MTDEQQNSAAQSKPCADVSSTPHEAPLSGGMITREQFVRGIAAIEQYNKMVGAIAAALRVGGCAESRGCSGDALAEELLRQLEERCSDPTGPDGSMIAYMLYDIGGPVRLADGREFMTGTAEELWAYWAASESGPFGNSGTSPDPSPEGREPNQ